LEVHAFAKINLTLDILRKREDGYHDLEMVMQSVSLYDTLRIVPVVQDKGVSITSTQRFIPNDERNLAVKAARAFFESTGNMIGLDMALTKRIPVCAGLGGGSADAAAVLVALNDLTGAGLTTRQLMALGEKVGSDVPYCVMGGTALARGKGEVLTELPPLPSCYVVLSKPDFSISTPELFSRVDLKKMICRPDTTGLLEGLRQRDLKQVARRVYNVFEDILPPRQRAMVDGIKQLLIHHGALGAAMTGTGSAVYGLFAAEQEANDAYSALSSRYQETFLTQTV